MRYATWMLFIVMACGGTQQGPPVSGNSAGGASQDAGGIPPDAGTPAGPDAGPADAGPADAGPANAGAGDAGAADAGVADAGAADAGVADAGVADAGGQDAGTADGGVAATKCDGIVPSQLGSSFSFEVSPPTSGTVSCDLATSDESGNLAASAGNDLWNHREWELFDPAGTHLGRIRATALFPRGRGFTGLGEYEGAIGDTFLRAAFWTPEGKRTDGPPVSGDTGDAVAFRAWPDEMLTVKLYCGNPASSSSGWRLTLFDSSAQEKASASVPGCQGVAGAVVDANRNWLLLVAGGPSIGFADGDLVAQWFDPAGKPLTGWFRVGPAGLSGPTIVHALIGGGAALSVDGRWTYLLPSGKKEVQAAPSFLAQHPGSDFTLVRGAAAYAVLPRTGDTRQMDLYSAAGDRCGSLAFPQGNLTTGADGSVIASSGPKGCTKTVWPALLH